MIFQLSQSFSRLLRTQITIGSRSFELEEQYDPRDFGRNLILKYGQVMKLITLLLASFFIGPVLAEGAKAETPFSKPPSSREIRQQFDVISDDWATIPDIVRLTVRVSQDQNFFDRPAGETALAIRIGRWLHEDIPPKDETRLEKSVRLNRPSETSVAIGEALSHEEILDWFINEVPMGQGCYGIPESAMAYFGKTIAELRLEEIAYLVASIGSPERFHPYKSHDQAIKRRNFLLLTMMAKDGLIPIEEAQNAADAPLSARNPLGTCRTNN